VDLQQGDYEEMDQLAIAKPVAKGRVPRAAAEDIGVASARAVRRAVSAAGRRVPGSPAKLFAQTMDAAAGRLR